MKYCKSCGTRPREIWPNTQCEYCLHLPIYPQSAVAYENKRKMTHPEEFDDPTPKPIPKDVKTGYGAFIEKIESKGAKNSSVLESKTLPHINKDCATELPIKYQGYNLSHLPQPNNQHNEPNWNMIFLTFILTAFAIVGFLRLSGAFDSNFKSEGEIRLDAYSECINMNGINCNRLLSQ